MNKDNRNGRKRGNESKANVKLIRKRQYNRNGILISSDRVPHYKRHNEPDY